MIERDEMEHVPTTHGTDTDHDWETAWIDLGGEG